MRRKMNGKMNVSAFPQVNGVVDCSRYARYKLNQTRANDSVTTYGGVVMCTQEQLDRLAAIAQEGRFEELPNPLSAPEAAAIARCSKPTITRACKSGRLKADNTGMRWKINRDSLLAYAALI